MCWQLMKQLPVECWWHILSYLHELVAHVGAADYIHDEYGYSLHCLAAAHPFFQELIGAWRLCCVRLSARTGALYRNDMELLGVLADEDCSIQEILNHAVACQDTDTLATLLFSNKADFASHYYKLGEVNILSESLLLWWMQKRETATNKSVFFTTVAFRSAVRLGNLDILDYFLQGDLDIYCIGHQMDLLLHGSPAVLDWALEKNLIQELPTGWWGLIYCSLVNKERHEVITWLLQHPELSPRTVRKLMFKEALQGQQIFILPLFKDCDKDDLRQWALPYLQAYGDSSLVLLKCLYYQLHLSLGSICNLVEHTTWWRTDHEPLFSWLDGFRLWPRWWASIFLDLVRQRYLSPVQWICDRYPTECLFVLHEAGLSLSKFCWQERGRGQSRQQDVIKWLIQTFCLPRSFALQALSTMCANGVDVWSIHLDIFDMFSHYFHYTRRDLLQAGIPEPHADFLLTRLPNQSLMHERRG